MWYGCYCLVDDCCICLAGRCRYVIYCCYLFLTYKISCTFTSHLNLLAVKDFSLLIWYPTDMDYILWTSEHFWHEKCWELWPQLYRNGASMMLDLCGKKIIDHVHSARSSMWLYFVLMFVYGDVSLIIALYHCVIYISHFNSQIVEYKAMNSLSCSLFPQLGSSSL